MAATFSRREGVAGLPGGPRSHYALVARHPAFLALAARVRRRRLLAWTQAGVLGAAGGAALLALAGRLAGWPAWAGPAALWAVLAFAAALAAAMVWRPDDWAVAHAADELGLEERTATALYALGGGRAPRRADRPTILLARFSSGALSKCFNAKRFGRWFSTGRFGRSFGRWFSRWFSAGAAAPGPKGARLLLRSRLKPAAGGVHTGAPFRGLRMPSRDIHALADQTPAIDTSVAALVAADAAGALDALDPGAYRLVPSPRRWQVVGIAGLALLAVVLLPIPAVGPGQRRAAEASAVAAARRGVQALEAAQPKPTTPSPLTQATAAELQALDQQLAQSRDAAEAARALERAQERLAGLPQPDDYAARRAMEGLTATWAGQPDLAGVAQALRSDDPQAVDRAVADLAARADQMTDAQRQQLQVALQAGANAARDVPDLAAALRRAAQATANSRAAQDGQAGQGDPNAENGQEGQQAQGSQNSQSGAAGAAIRDLSAPLAQGAAGAAGAQGAQQALSGLNNVRASLGALNANGPPAAGTVSGTVVSGQVVPGAATGTPSALAVIPVQASGAPGGGAGGSGSNGTGGSAGNGSNGTGMGQSGSAGAGQGSGAGLGSAPGRPAPPDQHTGSGPNAPRDLVAPNTASATTYDRVYAPSLMGGEGGQAVQAPGDPSGAGGDTVTLPNSPLTTGAERPYDEVYGQYESTARQSVARQALPPPLQGLVQRYFSSIDPNQK